MPTFTLSLAPQTRTADAAVSAPRKNLRVLSSATMTPFGANCIKSDAGTSESTLAPWAGRWKWKRLDTSSRIMQDTHLTSPGPYIQGCDGWYDRTLKKGVPMAGTYKITELVGTSPTSFA